MRVHWLQHAEHEALGCIGPWLATQRATVSHTRLYRDEPLPRADQFDALIVLGGPMNIYEHEAHPWLVAEKALIREAWDSKRKILGICLGAQLLADVLGGKVSRNPAAEIGFFEVQLTPNARECRLLEAFPERFAAFHWHTDTFTIPPGATHLMKSDACVNQAYAYDGRAAALQFHLEVRREDAALWLQDEALPPGRYVQTAAEILRDPERFALNNRLMISLLERLLA